jgi:hypothetical protein
MDIELNEISYTAEEIDHQIKIKNNINNRQLKENSFLPKMRLL